MNAENTMKNLKRLDRLIIDLPSNLGALKSEELGYK